MNTRTDKHVQVIVAPDGACTIDALNFSDASCTQATQQLIAALGGQVVADRLNKRRRIPLVTDAMIRRLSPIDKRSYEAGFMGSDWAGLYKPDQHKGA